PPSPHLPRGPLCPRARCGWRHDGWPGRAGHRRPTHGRDLRRDSGLRSPPRPPKLIGPRLYVCTICGDLVVGCDAVGGVTRSYACASLHLQRYGKPSRPQLVNTLVHRSSTLDGWLPSLDGSGAASVGAVVLETVGAGMLRGQATPFRV